MRRFLHALRPMAVSVALLVLVTACGGSASDGSVIGSGRIPESMPDGFPIPAGAVIGQTSMDRAARTRISPRREA